MGEGVADLVVTAACLSGAADGGALFATLPTGMSLAASYPAFPAQSSHVVPDWAELIKQHREKGNLVRNGAESVCFLLLHSEKPSPLSLCAVPVQNQRFGLEGSLLIYWYDSCQGGHANQALLALTILAEKIAGMLCSPDLFEENQGRYRWETIEAFAAAMEAKDSYTWGHCERVGRYSHAMAEGLGLTPMEVERVSRGALLHDIGKLAISSEALNKLGRLSREEYRIVMSHPDKGRRILQPVSLLRDILPEVYYHHERFDGGGYPEGISGDNIPLGARILSVADAFDAMTSARSYREPFSLARAVEELQAFSSSQFDPHMVTAFVDVLQSGKIKPCSFRGTANQCCIQT